MIAKALQRLAVPIESLTPHPRNARQGDVGAISQSLERFGQVRPIVVQKSTGYVVAGNHVHAAARALGWPKVARVAVEMTDQEALAYLVADNRIADLGTYDDRGIADLLGEMAADGGLEGTGYDEEDYGRLLADIARDEQEGGHAGLDVAPDLPGAPLSVVGGVYNLGPHVLVCGDARDPDAVAEACGGGHATAMWTDPPYGVEYVGKTADALTIVGDHAAGLSDLLCAVYAAVDSVLQSPAGVYVAAPSGPRLLDFMTTFESAGWRLRQVLVWDKGAIVLGHSDYHYTNELVLYGGKPPARGRFGRGAKGWYGDHAQGSVAHIDGPSRSDSHPTMKPVDLVRGHLANSAPPGALVLDPFAGSGTTMVAAETLGQRAALVEIDPAYCDVIRQRYADLVGDPSLAPS